MSVYIRAMAKSDKDIQPKKRNALKYGVIALFSLFLGYHSFYAVSLDERETEMDQDDMEQLVEAYFSQTLPAALEQAPAPCTLLHALSKEEDGDWTAYGKQTNIGNRYYFLVRGTGVIKEITDSYISVAFDEDGETCTLRIATVYIFGNEIRDAAGELSLQDMGDLAKFNAVSGLMNKKVRDEILPDFLKKAQVGQKIAVDGAFAWNRRIGTTDDFEVMPVQVRMVE